MGDSGVQPSVEAIQLPRDARLIANAILVLGVALVTGQGMEWLARGTLIGPVWIPLLVCYAGWGLLNRYESGRHWAIGVAVMLALSLPFGAIFLLAKGADCVAEQWLGKPPKMPMTFSDFLGVLVSLVVGAAGFWSIRVLRRADSKAACGGDDPERTRWRFGLMDWFRVSIGVAVGLTLYTLLADRAAAG